jgi:hypothetical protein
MLWLLKLMMLAISKTLPKIACSSTTIIQINIFTIDYRWLSAIKKALSMVVWSCPWLSKACFGYDVMQLQILHSSFGESQVYYNLDKLYTI